jgi:hypothetical protein
MGSLLHRDVLDTAMKGIDRGFALLLCGCIVGNRGLPEVNIIYCS